MFRSSKPTTVESHSGVGLPGASILLDFSCPDHSTQFSQFLPCLCHSALHVVARYLKDWTGGKLTISVSIFLVILTGSVSPAVMLQIHRLLS